jgi:glutathione S-transferase
MLPVLYSFRRCPYAMRARLALATAGLQAGKTLELREVVLRTKPPELLECSPKGTVPVLLLPDGRLLEESLAIMRWALEQADPQGWLQGRPRGDHGVIDALIAENDGPFKHHLDRFKYPDRYPGETTTDHRLAAFAILQRWSERMAGGGWLLGDRCSLADTALLPFVRQFRLADPEGFDTAVGLAPLQVWLERFLRSPELAAVMDPPWAERAAWCSPSWLYHLALRSEWTAARAAGVYRQSTRGRSLEEVGFIHLSRAHQLRGTAQRFYADVPVEELLLLTIDPRRLEQALLEVRDDPAPESGELFPHLYGALPLEAVLVAQPYAP